MKYKPLPNKKMFTQKEMDEILFQDICEEKELILLEKKELECQIR
jgi:hypothetical protein